MVLSLLATTIRRKGEKIKGIVHSDHYTLQPRQKIVHGDIEIIMKNSMNAIMVLENIIADFFREGERPFRNSKQGKTQKPVKDTWRALSIKMCLVPTSTVHILARNKI